MEHLVRPRAQLLVRSAGAPEELRHHGLRRKQTDNENETDKLVNKDINIIKYWLKQRLYLFRI